MKFIRWKYVAPRIMMLAMLAISVRFGCDPLLEWAIVTSGQSATGAKVEIAELTSWIRAGKIELRDLQVANPDAVMRNLVQADHIVLQLDSLALLHNRVVVTNGAITGIELDTERSTSGELVVIDDAIDDAPSALDPLVAKAGDLASDWLDEASKRLDADLVDQLQTPQVAESLSEKWQSKADALRSRTNQLKLRGQKLAEEFRDIKKNPLRGVERIPQLQAELKTNQMELQSLQQEIKGLPQQAETDHQALLAARQQDEAFLRKQFEFEQLNGDNLTQILLGQSVAEKLQEACEWIAWARKKAPGNAAKQLASQRGRGTMVTYGRARPQFEVRHLGVELTAQIAGQELQFVGYVSGISSAPQLLEEPARMEIAALGDVPMKLLMVSDHRGHVPCEELHFDCPALPMEGRTLGSGEKLAVDLAPGTADLSVDLQLVGDSLSGQINFAQQDFRLSPCSNPKVNKHLATVLGEALGKIEQVTAKVELAGTLTKPQFKINSPLGTQLASEISTAVAKLARVRGETLLAETTSKMNSQLEKLNATKSALQQELLSNLGENQKLFEDLASLSGTNGRGLSVPQLGSTLGKQILRK
ncbi:TIGR03545 family protein [Bythopirellula polymerisocia]|uniref:TIGR03545 family protein n=1 Tax=Bythopirellula polymerisocia TaxID=2528003 RepID=UPI0018D394D9|nr:TIGR03545 family protein [Bythopirellula polymerisocia]